MYSCGSVKLPFFATSPDRDERHHVVFDHDHVQPISQRFRYERNGLRIRTARGQHTH